MPGELNRIRKYKWSKRITTHGFMERNSTKAGKRVLQNRRKKGRKILTVSKQKQ